MPKVNTYQPDRTLDRTDIFLITDKNGRTKVIDGGTLIDALSGEPSTIITAADTDCDIAASQTHLECPVYSGYNNNMYARGAGSVAGTQRLFCFNNSQTTPYFGYYNFSNIIQHMATDQLI